jgi:hypothetical protein
VAEEMTDVAGIAGDHVVDTSHLRTRRRQQGTHVRTEKAGTPENYQVFAFKLRELVQAGAASGFAIGFVQFLDLRLHRRNGTSAEDPGSRGLPDRTGLVE